MHAGASGEHVAAVILSYNGREDTLACVESLGRSEWDRTTTIVVDNGSSDGSADAVRNAHPDAVVVETGTNLGFAEGNNVGIRRALELGADHVLLLNNDTLLAPDAIGLLVEEARHHPRAAALCPLILFADPPDAIWYAGAVHDPRRWHNGRQAGYGEPDTGQFAVPAPTERLSGAAVLLPRAALEDVGLLDADLFLHVEDTEWSLRMRRRGWEIWLVPAARVVHKVSVASGGEHSPTIAYYAARNTMEVGDLYADGGWTRRAVRHAGTLAVHVVHARRASRPLLCARAAVAGWRDHRRGLLGPRESPRPRSEPPPSCR